MKGEFQSLFIEWWKLARHTLVAIHGGQKSVVWANSQITRDFVTVTIAVSQRKAWLVDKSLFL